MNFGNKDEILETAEAITATTVTWRWREGQKQGLILNDVAPYIGYIIKYSVDENTWYDSNRIPFQVTEDLGQEGRVTGLQPDTQYWFDIVVYRIYTGGTLYISTNTARGVIGRYLAARTTPGTGVTRKYYLRSDLYFRINCIWVGICFFGVLQLKQIVSKDILTEVYCICILLFD